MGVRSTKFRQSGRSIQYESSQRTGGGSTWIQRYKWTYVHSQSGGTPATFPVTSGSKYVFFGVAPGGNGGTSGEGPNGTAGGGGGSSQINGYLWTAPASGDVTVTTTQGSNLTLVLPTASPTTIFSLNKGANAGPTHTNVGVGGSVGTFGSSAGGNGGQGGNRQPTYGDAGSPGGGAPDYLAGAGGGGAGSFYSNYGSNYWGRSEAGSGGANYGTTKSVVTLFDPGTDFGWNVLLQDGSTGFQMVGTYGAAGGGSNQVPTSVPVPAIPGPPWSAPNNGASGGGGGGGGGVRFTSTSPSLGDAFGGGGGAGPSAPTTGAPGFFIAFRLDSSAT